MAITRVQTITQTGSGTSLGITPSSSPTNGNAQVLTIGYNSGVGSKVSSITQSGATWVFATQGINPTGQTVEIWYSLNIASPATSLTINLASSVTVAATYLEYTNVATTSALDKTATSYDESPAVPASGAGSDPQTGTTVATTQANEVVVGGVFIDSNQTFSSATNSFTHVNTSATPCLTCVEKIVSSTGTQGTVISYGFLLSFNSAGAIATFKEAVTQDNSGFFEFFQ